MPSDTLTTSEKDAEAARVYAESIIETVREPLLVLDENLYVVSANRAYHDTFGEPSIKTDNRLVYELGNRQWDTPELRQLLEALIFDRAEFHDFVMVHSFPVSGARTMRLNARPLHRPVDAPRAGSNRTGMLLLAIEDVTAQQRMTEALQRSETRYRRLFEAARDGILILDSEHGRITDANPFMTELLGYSRDELLGKALWEIGLLKDKKANQEAFQRLEKAGYIRYEDLPLENQRGERRDVEFVSNRYQENGHTVIQCNIRDITERKALEAELRETQAKDKNIATVLQRAMLFQPNEDAFSGIIVQTAYAVASEEALVGGDFWDTFAYDHGHVALVLGDVMGHGLSSAIFTTELQHTLRAYIREHEQPGRILNQMNHFMCQSNRLFREGINTEGSDAPVCVALAIVERETGAGTVAVAGMEQPLLVRASGESEQSAATGLPLGVEPEEEYQQIDFQLEAGDTLVLVTDGITEARQGKTFLEGEGLVRLAVEGNKGTLKAMANTILGGAKEFAGGKLRDDASLVLVRRTATSPRIEKSAVP